MENRKIKILAIDDNKDNLVTLKALIKESFPEALTLTALNGKSGLELAAAEDPDVILLDIIMPGLDGFAVCKKLKKDKKLSDIPVIFFTSIKGDRENRVRALEAGAEAFLAKPIDKNELTAQIRAMLKIKAANIKKRDEKKLLAALVEEKTRELKTAYSATLNLLEDLKKENEARNKSDVALRALLAEKEVLLKEVHHRVKNNLMTLIGLIKMQEAKADNVTFSALLQELEGRVRAMAQVHESLHKSKDLAHVDLQDYIETMSAHIRAQYGAERDISFSLQMAGAEVNLDIAVPCGLILNELITNACKHAFPSGQPGEICVSLQERRGTAPGRDRSRPVPTEQNRVPTFELTVTDNGVGLPAKVNWENPETIGLQLVRMLSRQINGSIELDRSVGTAFRLQFPVASHDGNYGPGKCGGCGHA